MDYLKHQYSFCFRFMRSSLKKSFILSFVIFLLVSVACYLFLFNNLELLLSSVENVLATFDSKGIEMDYTLSSSVALFKNNLTATFLMVGAGFVPFLFLPLLLIVINAAPMGVLAAYFAHIPELGLTSFLVGILPHGIFEFVAIFLSSALGIYLCLALTKKIVGKEVPLTKILISLLKIYAYIVIPLLIIAALIEGLITPRLLELSLSII